MRLGSTSSVVLGLLMLVGPVFSQATWWVDKSCDGKLPKDEVDKMMEEVVDTAKLIRDRIIRSESDEEDAHRAFETLFKFKTSTQDTDDQERLKVFQRIIGGFSEPSTYGLVEYKKSPGTGDLDRRLSLVRIYCDNGDRFELVKDGEETIEPKVPKNSERKPENQEFFDKINKIWKKGDVKCGKLTNKEPLMSTIRWSGENKYDIGKGGNELPHRSSITICDNWINIEKRVSLFGSLPTDKTLSISKKAKESIHYLRMVGSMALLHEMTHTWPHQTRDWAYSAGSWGLDKLVAYLNADSYGILAVIMRSMERKYALNRDHPEKGELHKYKDIPDRTKHTKRSVLELNGALHKKDSTSACENRYDSTGVEMHCKKFVV